MGYSTVCSFYPQDNQLDEGARISLPKTWCYKNENYKWGCRFRDGMGGEPMAQTFISRAGAPQPDREPGSGMEEASAGIAGTLSPPSGHCLGASAAWAGLQRDWEGVSRCKQLWLLWVPCSTRLGWIKGGCGPDSHQRKNGFNYLGGSSNGLFQEGLLSQYFHPDPFCPAFAPTDQLATPSPTPPIPKRLDWKVLSASPNPRHPWSLILP